MRLKMRGAVSALQPKACSESYLCKREILLAYSGWLGQASGMVGNIILIIILVAGVVTFFWQLLKSSSNKIHTQYRQLSQRFELELTEFDPKLMGFIRPEPFVFGTYRGREMSISAPGKGLQNTRQSESLLKMELGNKAFQAQMTGAGVLGGMRQRDSGVKSRWQSGDADFDAMLDVRTNQDEQLRRVLSSELRIGLSGLLKGSKSTLYVNKGVIALSELGLIADVATRKRFEQATELLCDLAEAIEALDA